MSLERGVEVEDVANLERGAVVHHQVSTNHHVHIVRRRWGQHDFEFAWAGLHFFLQAWRQGSVHDQLTLESGRQAVALG